MIGVPKRKYGTLPSRTRVASSQTMKWVHRKERTSQCVCQSRAESDTEHNERRFFAKITITPTYEGLHGEDACWDGRSAFGLKTRATIEVPAFVRNVF